MDWTNTTSRSNSCDAVLHVDEPPKATDESKTNHSHSVDQQETEDSLKKPTKRISFVQRNVTISDRESIIMNATSDFYKPFLGEVAEKSSRRMMLTRAVSTIDRANGGKTISEKTIQPGRRAASLRQSNVHGDLSKSFGITAAQLLDFFKKLQMEHILLQVALSCGYTAFVMYACKDEWKDRLQVSTLAVSILGGFLSFALVFRTQTCYARWWEGRTQWGIMIYACIHTAQQGRSWIRDEELAEEFMVYCMIFPYACKAMLRGNSLADENEEGDELVANEMISREELNNIVGHGWQPMYCIEILREIMNKAFMQSEGTNLKGEGMRDGALKSMEDSFRVLATNIGACLKVKSTGLPVTYDLFTSIFISVFFIVANLAWAPNMLWYTPIITGVILSLMNTVIVIGNQMLGAFEVQWAGLPLQKFCAIIEKEITCIQMRHLSFSRRFGNKKYNDNQKENSGRASTSSRFE